MATKIIEISSKSPRAPLMTHGRDYFGKWAKAYNIEDVDPDVLSEMAPPPGTKRGPTKSRVGGRITHDLERLEPAETEQRRELSEEFLKQPVRHFPGD